jgi:glycolate oxidase iron-sulfur subunit
VEKLLESAGFTLTAVEQATACCGSAGTYSLLQPDISQALRERKLATLVAGQPLVIASANIGCIEHLGAVAPVPVRHWIELIDEALSEGDAAVTRGN